MRISDIRTYVLEAPLSQPFGWSFQKTSKRSTCIVEITTDNGLVGWGECFGPSQINAAIIKAFEPHLIGHDALATEAVWQLIYNQFRDQGQKGVTICALSGIDIALWDIKGKAFGAPIHQVMGGPLRIRVEAYATGTYRRDEGDPFEYIIDEVRGYTEEGFSGVKLKIGRDVDEDAELIRAVRAAIGKDHKLMLDANHGYDAVEAIDLGRRIADQNISWFEEPVAPEDRASYQEVRRGQPIPVAGGECEFTRWGFHDILTGRTMDIIQPDTCAAGGISECKKIADMATVFGLRYIPHVWGTGIGMSAALQLLAVIPHTPPRYTAREPLLEFDRSEHPFRQAVLVKPIEHVDGWVDIPQGPGLGIEVSRQALADFEV